MKGIIFNLLEQFITENFGEEKYEQIIKQCNLKTTEPFVAPGTYPDEDMIEIVVNTSKELNITVPDALKGYGKFAFFKLAEKFPFFVKPYKHPKPFLMSVENIIHVEVRKFYKDAYTPQFIYNDTSPDTLTITYHSKRKLYHLMEGLLDGVGEFYKVPIQQTHKIYQKNGTELCDFELTFAGK